MCHYRKPPSPATSPEPCDFPKNHFPSEALGPQPTIVAVRGPAQRELVRVIGRRRKRRAPSGGRSSRTPDRRNFDSVLLSFVAARFSPGPRMTLGKETRPLTPGGFSCASPACMTAARAMRRRIPADHRGLIEARRPLTWNANATTAWLASWDAVISRWLGIDEPHRGTASWRGIDDRVCSFLLSPSVANLLKQFGCLLVTGQLFASTFF
jgi:hypothetical protein